MALAPLSRRMADETGVFVLERGADAMMLRAWLSESAEQSIDAQYFIFSADNVGKIATDYLIRAAQRGVRVRLIVDDILVQADALELLALDAIENLSIKVYNPNVNVGKTLIETLGNAVTDFRGINQRMHNKAFIVDGSAAITGGRNIADEYFDHDHAYNFRDRDVLLLGEAGSQAQRSFEQFWNHPLTVRVGELLQRQPDLNPRGAAEALRQYACNPDNFWPSVRVRIDRLPDALASVRASGELHWVRNVRFFSDAPGKNVGDRGLAGGGVTAEVLASLIEAAAHQVFIQTPYLVTTGASRQLLADAVARGVDVKILTNSLASTDNLEAFSGYARDRAALLATGAEIYEWRPDAAIRAEMMRSELTRRITRQPVFAIHAKTMVVDSRQTVVGTFNFDPRSENLNTECVTVIPSAEVSEGVLRHLRREIARDNAWRVTAAANPDADAGIVKRAGLLWRRLIPKSVL